MKKFLRFGISYKGRYYTNNGTQTDSSGHKYNDDTIMGTTWNMMPGDFFTLNFYNYMGQFEEHDNSTFTSSEVYGDFWGSTRLIGGMSGETSYGQYSSGHNRWLIYCAADENGNPYLMIRARGFNDDAGDVKLGHVLNDYPEWRIGYFNSILENGLSDSGDIP